MTNPNDPNMNRRVDFGARGEKSRMGWVIGGLAVIALIAIVIYAFSDNAGTRTATDTNVNRPAATIGSGAAGGTAKSLPAPTNR